MSSIKSRMKYWRSLDELAETAEFQEALGREFPDQRWDELPQASRRSFLKVMGASLAFAGLTSCRWPQEEIVPFAHRPEGRIPGVPQYFATSYEMQGVALGMVVTSVDGRPIKAEGNPQHPDSRGALSAMAQAQVLELYDPDRSTAVLYRGGGSTAKKTWHDVEVVLAEAMMSPDTAILSEALSSPTVSGLRQRLLEKNNGLSWYEYEPVSRDNERQGSLLACARPVRLAPQFEQARVIVCFDADPLIDHPRALGLAREFAQGRRPDATAMSRLWVAESGHTLTGAQADHRLAIASSRIPVLLATLASKLADQHHLEFEPVTRQLFAKEAFEAGADFVTRLAEDLAANRGQSLVMAGPRQAPEVHALVLVVNQALGNVGTTLRVVEDNNPQRPHHRDAIVELAGRIKAGEITKLVMLGGNPAYDAPVDLGFTKLLQTLEMSAHLSLFDNETSKMCQWSLPRAHAFEAWGDGRAWDGTLTMQQPLIEPLYGGKTPAEILAMVLGEPAAAYDLVRAAAKVLFPGVDFEKTWRRLLHDGVREDSGFVSLKVDFAAAGLEKAALGLKSLCAAASKMALELVLTPDSKIHDGRFANNGWLQELPDAVTKITWDNAILLSPATAREHGVAHGDVVQIDASETSVIEAPVYLLPGMAHDSLSLALGYGRSEAGVVGNAVGVNAYLLRHSMSSDIITGVDIRPTGRTHTFAMTQDHHVIDATGFKARNERSGQLVREATIAELRAHPDIIKHQVHEPELFSLWTEKAYTGEQWGMSIDLNSCTGCNACIVACQAENNIPVVGREQVINQREMQWIRLDRYFKTAEGIGPDEVDEAAMVFQPVACVHCENAPCEQVCPVAATQHTEDGLNAMVYNRCIGTRYCANNCPYKVRRFNFFNYHKALPEMTKMQFNPEVTVRSRGVMEKCSFCVQRIENTRIIARNEGRDLVDGEIVPACAQTCPSQAIVFGDLNKPASAVSMLRTDVRSYATLAELNIKPRTHYMARIRNPFEKESGQLGESGESDPHHNTEDHGNTDDHGHEKESS